jgi:eukaryotic translation initiation factor 2C
LKTGKDATFTIDLDIAAGKKSNGKNIFHVAIKWTKALDFATLASYLAQKCDMDNSILETLSFLDHLMREYPSRKYTQIKKSFFARGQVRFPLGSGVEAFKGVFASMRMIHNIPSPSLSVNVDVANGTFFTSMSLLDMMRNLCRARTNADLVNMYGAARKDWHGSPMYRFLRALTHVTVTKVHMPVKDGVIQEFKIHRFSSKDPFDTSFEIRTKNDNGEVVGKGIKTSVADYFRQKYNIQATRGLPVVQLTKGDMVPVEALVIPENQRYKVKLDDKQTSMVSYPIHSFDFSILTLRSR